MQPPGHHRGLSAPVWGRRHGPVATIAAVDRVLQRALLALVAVVCLVSAWASGGSPALAIEIELTEQRVQRDVLALYDSRSERLVHETRIHQFAEMPLNHLGYRVIYHDVMKPLPPVSELEGVRGVLTWFLEPMQDDAAATLLAWLEGVTARGLKHVVLGEVAPGASEFQFERIARLHERLGLSLTGEYIDVTYKARVLNHDRDMVGFERPLDKVLPDFPVVSPLPGKVVAHLVVEADTRDGPARSAVVATSANGGFVASNFAIYFEPVSDRVLWVVNPFAFFRLALGAERMPIPDVTTLSGRRIYFSHIDGDGWNNLTEVEPYREQERLSAEVIAEQAIVPYPDLPVSVALIGGDMEPKLGGSSAGQAVARLLYALPQVEVASHTYSHPYNWSFFERYDRTAELEAVAKAQRPVQSVRERLVGALASLAGREATSARYNPFVAGTDDLPRTYLKEPFDLEMEIAGALAVAERFAPAGKRAKLYQWSGDTTPFEGALRATRRAGVRNINGGDSRLDRAFPSVAYVPPIGRLAGSERQIYAANSNENTYTNDWTGPYYGFFLLEETLRNTEAPRRLKPFNLYYHMYSGEKAAALAAVRHFLDRARTSEIIPVPASQYAAIADDFFATEIRKVDTLAWEVGSRGALQTVRFDDADALSLDLERSQGVLGAQRTNGALYVSLDASIETALVVLKDGGSGSDEISGRGLMLVDARWQVRDRRDEDCGMRVETQGFGRGDMTWKARPGRAFEVALERDARVLSREIVRADGDGLISLRLEPDASAPLTLKFTCHE